LRNGFGGIIRVCGDRCDLVSGQKHSELFGLFGLDKLLSTYFVILKWEMLIYAVHV